jgi:hypothetical protein
LLIGIWSLSLINKIEIHILAITVSHRCANPAAISKTTISFRLHNLIHIILLSIGTELLLTSITSFNLIHEIAIDHCVSHLDLIVLRKFAAVAGCLKSSNFSLIKHIWFTSLDGWKHVVDSGIVSGLKHDAIVRCVHFINA